MAKVTSQEIYDHAAAHYERSGWDMVVECKSLRDIQSEIEDYEIESIEDYDIMFVAPYAEQRCEVEATGDW